MNNKLGVCCAPDKAHIAAACGFEFIELNMSALHALDEAAYREALALVKASPIPVAATNVMFPGTLRLTGPECDMALVEAYMDKAFARAAEVGAKVCVFGSGQARSAQPGWDYAECARDLARLIRVMDGYAAKHGVRVALEPLRAMECNMLNYVTEAVLLAAALDLPNVGVLADSHHMICGGEPFANVSRAGKRLLHAHISHSLGEPGRVFPSADTREDSYGFMLALKNAGYEGRISLEAGCEDFEKDGKAAFAVLDGIRKAM